MYRKTLKTFVKKKAKSILETLNLLDVPKEDPKECLQGSLAFTMAGKWVDGTTLRDMMAGSTALAATWASVGNETDPLDKTYMTKGPYLIKVDVNVSFEPMDPSEYVGPVYNGAALVQYLQMKKGKRPIIN